MTAIMSLLVCFVIRTNSSPASVSQNPGLGHSKLISTILVKQDDIHGHCRQISGISPSHEYVSPAPVDLSLWSIVFEAFANSHQKRRRWVQGQKLSHYWLIIPWSYHAFRHSVASMVSSFRQLRIGVRSFLVLLKTLTFSGHYRYRKNI